MSDDKRDDKQPPEINPPDDKSQPHEHHLHLPDLQEAGDLVRTGKRKLNIWFHSAMGAGTLLLLCIIGLFWYANTPQFAALVRKRVEVSLATATGGRVELKNFSWSMWHRTITIEDLTIHGLEKPGVAPYLHVDQVDAQLRWSGFFFSSYVYLESLRVVHPSFNLIVDKDGNTNQPHPLHAMTPMQQTLLDLAVSRISVENGVATINTHAVPIDFVARNTSLTLHYVPATLGTTDDAHAEHYTADFAVEDIRTRAYDETRVSSHMQGHFLFSKNILHLDKFSWSTGQTELNASATIDNLAQPHWNAAITGTVDIHQVAAITGIDGFNSGTARLNLTAHSCDKIPAGKEPPPRRKILLPMLAAPHGMQNNCTEAFILQGEISGTNAAWTNEIVQVQTKETDTQIFVTPHEMDFLNMKASLADGANGHGDLHIYNYFYTGPAGGHPTGPRLHGVLDAEIANVPLHDVLYSLAPKQFQPIQYNTSANGNVHVEWSDYLDDADVRGALKLHPLANQPGVPITGAVEASYTGKTSVIKITSLNATTPQSSAEISGVLGVLNGDPLTALHADISTHDPAEFNSLLSVFNMSAKTGPVVLRGTAEYHGSLSGPLKQLDLHGHVTANNLDLNTEKLLAQNNLLQPTIHLDAVSADLDASPVSVNVQDAKLQQGDAWITLHGQLHGQLHAAEDAHRYASPHTHASTDSFSGASSINVDAESHALPITNIFIAPLSGTLDSNVHLTGTLAQPLVSGTLTARNGTIADQNINEPYRTLTATLNAQGTLWSLQNATLVMPAGKLTGEASIDSKSQRLTWQLHTAGFKLAKLQSIAPRTGLTGLLDADASAAGTANGPGIRGTLRITSLAFAGQNAGTLTANMHSSGQQLLYQLQMNALNGHLDGAGQTSLSAAHDTQLHASFTGLDLAPLLQLSRYRMSGHSELGGEFTMNGPLSTPSKLTGSASINRFHVELSGVALDAAEPLHLSMGGNILHLDQVHITGPDTNLHLQGTADFARAGRLRLHTDGSINLKILQTFDPDLVSTGHVVFSVDANGALLTPDYSGNVNINNAALALVDLPNGLTQINGTLAFNHDRLEMKQLTAMTGGGQVSLGGSINLRGGIYADITVRGHDNRIRYPQGVSSSADTDLRLQGTPSNALLSGNILLTRFGINQEFDFSSLAATAAGVTAPPDPNAPSSHLRLDVHVTSAPQLDFQNSFAKLVGDVDLNLRGTVAAPSVLGRINISEGSASFAGTKYELQSGAIAFNNPVRIEPLVNLDATARVRDYDIYISLHGNLANLRPNYRSEPPLPQSDILALLALGRTQQEAGIYQQQQEQGGADTADNTLLGGALNQTVSNRAQRLFGVGSVKIDPTFIGTLGNSSARITVEQSVSRDVTVTYATNVNETAEQLIQVTWDLTHNVSLVSQRDENGVFSMSFKIRQRHR